MPISTSVIGVIEPLLRPKVRTTARIAIDFYRSQQRKCFPTRLYGLKGRPNDEYSVENPRRALVSYLSSPFMLLPNDPTSRQFSNSGIARTLVSVLQDLDYIVDVVNYDDTGFRPRPVYDLFIGHGGINFQRIACSLPRATVKIYFSSGSYWKVQNERARVRVEDLSRRRDVRLQSDRAISHSEEWANANADGIIALGGPSVLESYAQFDRVVNLNNSSYGDPLYDLGGKDFASGIDKFLFFAGPGNVHKGLDLLLEAFCKTDKHLYICQELRTDFIKAYWHELHNAPNIHYLGKVALHSDQFNNLMESCNYVVLPSCSEGQPGSVIDCMCYGLIPIVSRESNIETKDFGITLQQCTVEEITRIVLDVSSRPTPWHQEMARRTQAVAQADFSPQKFYENMKRSILHLCRSATDSAPGN